jgi:hypothetical protein
MEKDPDHNMNVEKVEEYSDLKLRKGMLTPYNVTLHHFRLTKSI